MKKLERLFYIFSFASFLFMPLSCSNLMNPAGINKDTDDTKLYTVTGRVEFSGAVPQEMADALLNNADNSNGAKNAVPVGLSCSRNVKYREKNSNTWDSITLNNDTFVISLPAGDYELMAVVAANQTGEQLFEILESDVYSLSIGAQNKKYNPVLTLKPVTKGRNGCINLKIKKTEAYDYFVAKFDDNAEQKMKYAPNDGDYYYLNGALIMNGEPQNLNSVSCGIHKLDLYFYNNSNQLVYYCHEIINVFNQLTTDGWSGDGHIHNGSDENCIKITPALVAEFAMSNVYVDETSKVQAAVGTYQEPFQNLKDAIDYINRSAAAFDAADGTGTAPDYTIWLKSNVTIPSSQSDGYVFNTSKLPGKDSKKLIIRSSGENKKYEIDCSACEDSVFEQIVSSLKVPDYYALTFKDLKFKNYKTAIKTDQTVTIDNCTFGKVSNSSTDSAVWLVFDSLNSYAYKGHVILKGKTTFEEKAPIYLEGLTDITLSDDTDSPFVCNDDYITDIKVKHNDYYEDDQSCVLIGKTIIKDNTQKNNVLKFKITNYWYDIVKSEKSDCDEGNVVPHMYVAPDSEAIGGNGTETKPFKFSDAIHNFNNVSGYLSSSTPVTITLEKGAYSISSITSNLFADSVSNTNLTIEGAGKRTGNEGTKITIDCNPSTYSIVSWKNDSSKFTLKNLTIDGNDKQFGSSVFFFDQSPDGKLISANLENAEFINFKTKEQVPLFEIWSNLSVKNVTIKDCMFKDSSFEGGNTAICYSGPAGGFTISGKNHINDNYVVDDFDHPTKTIPANIYLSKVGSSAVQSILTVTGSLAGSSIGVNTATAPTVTESVVFTSGYTQNGNSISNIRTIFTGDEYTVLSSNDSKEGALVTGSGTAKGDAIADNITFELSHYVIDLSQGDYSSGYPAISFTAKCDGTDITDKLKNKKMTVYCKGDNVKEEYDNKIIYNSYWLPDDYEITVEGIYNKDGKDKAYSGTFYVPIIKSDDLTYMSDDDPPTSGTYKIGTVAAINKIRTWTQSGDLSAGVTFEMTNDIELPADYAPISANTTYKFKANFNGNGHSLILNGASKCSSVFGYVQGAGSSKKSIIQNLTIKSKDNIIKSSFFYVFASSITYCDIENCVNECNVTVTGTSAQASGFVGSMGDYTVIKNCVNKGDITADITAAGFSSSTGSHSTISNCRNYGTITAKGSTKFLNAIVSAAGISLAVGGYAGNYVVNCCNTGDVTGPKICGGIVAVGQTQAEQGIFNCYNSGNITSTDSSAGGIAGCYSYNVNYKFLTIKNCCNYGNITGEEKGAVIGNIGDGGTISYANDFYLDGTAPSGAYGKDDSDVGIGKKTLTQFNDSANGPISDLNNGGEADGITFAGWIIGPQGYPVLKF